MRPEALTVTALAREMAHGRISPVEIADYCLDRIERLDPHLHAWTTVDAAGARAQAAAAEREIAAGRRRGPLHGVPVGIKDIFSTRGLRTTMGSPIFAHHVPDRDAAAVRILREAGAVILGKTATTEFATLDPGLTRNPHAPDHTPGGSSSGSAAAVAARMCPLATGTQTVGSIGRPAAYCGVVGFLPTADRIPLAGVFPVAWSLDHAGFFATSVADARLAYEAFHAPVADAAPEVAPASLRIGVVAGYFRERTEPDAWRRHEGLIDRLAGAGAEVVRLELPPSFEAAPPALWIIMRTEAAAAHERLHAAQADRYGSVIRGLIETGLLIPAVGYARARRVRRIYQREMAGLFERCDIILSPGARGPAPRGLESTGDPALSAPWTLADQPTLTLPFDLDAAGLPLGVQLTAPRHGEARLFAAAQWVEDVVGFAARPPEGS